MADRGKVTELGRLLGMVAREHHEATGGASSRWAEWYATRLQGEIDSHVGSKPTVAEIEAWLRQADERYQTENPDIPWPYFYADSIFDSTARDT